MPFQIPENLIFKNSRIRISCNISDNFNLTKKAIVIAGNKNGFLSLSNIILYSSNMLEEQIKLKDISFVKSSIEVNIVINEDIENIHGYISQISEIKYKWELSEVNIDIVSGAIHSLGYINNELHLDSGMSESEISVYCVVD